MNTRIKLSQSARALTILSACLSATSFANTDLTSSDANAIAVSGENAPYEGKLKVFDNSEYSKWLTFSNSGWVSYNFNRLVDISQYSVTSANDAPSRDPQHWQLEGSTDGVNWFSLDQRTGEAFASRYQKNNYAVVNSQPAQYVRFNVSQNHGANILQVAELEFIGTDHQSGAQLPVQDSGQLAKNAWQHYGPFSSTKNIIATTSGTGDTDLYMRKGQEATTKYYDCKSISPSSNETCSLSGSDIYVSVHGYSDVTFNINIDEEQSNDQWQRPQVDFVDMNPETYGSQLFKRIISDPAGHMAQRCVDVAQVLYTDPAQSSRFHHLRFELRAKDAFGNDFVAYKTGQDGSGEMTIAVSTAHLERLYSDSGNNDASIRDEIDGILFHEVTHGYNNSPLTTDGYGDGGPFWAFTEGLADAVRIGAGFHKTRSPDVNGSRQWLGGYTTSGFFLHYVREKMDPDFLRKFNQSAADMGNYTWSWDAAFRSITNRGVQDVWNEYKNYINNGGTLNY